MTFFKTIRAAAFGMILSTGGALAAGGAGYVEDYSFPFEGPFGSYDQQQLQRGLQVYHEVCSACHGLQYVYFRNLTSETGPGLPEDQVRAFAENYFVADTSPEAFPGDERPAGLQDRFPGSALENAPDLSLMAKARAGFSGPYGTGISPLINGIGGPEYIASLLTHYTGEEVEQAGTILYVNETMDGGLISMAPPLWDGMVEFADGSPNDVESMAVDVAAFLMWAAEPKLTERKYAGLTGVLFLLLLTVLLYFVNKKLWYPIKHPRRESPAE